MYFYEEYPVKPELQPWVRCIWALYSDDGRFDHWSKLLPDDTIEIIFSRNKIERKHEGSEKTFFEGSSHVASLKTHLQFARLGKEVDIIGIRLHPTAWSLFSDLPASAYINSIVPIGSFFRQGIDSSFEQSLLADCSLQSRIRLLEWTLPGLITQQVPEQLEIVHKATRKIIEENGAMKISELASRIACGEKSLSRYFQKHLGISPKHYSRVIRVRAMLKYKLTSEECSVSECAYQLGYYDLTHFNKELRTVGDLRPGELLYRQATDTSNVQLYMMDKALRIEKGSSPHYGAKTL